MVSWNRRMGLSQGGHEGTPAVLLPGKAIGVWPCIARLCYNTNMYQQDVGITVITDFRQGNNAGGSISALLTKCCRVVSVVLRRVPVSRLECQLRRL